jgi:hypothetical protein
MRGVISTQFERFLRDYTSLCVTETVDFNWASHDALHVTKTLASRTLGPVYNRSQGFHDISFVVGSQWSSCMFFLRTCRTPQVPSLSVSYFLNDNFSKHFLSYRILSFSVCTFLPTPFSNTANICLFVPPDNAWSL